MSFVKKVFGSTYDFSFLGLLSFALSAGFVGAVGAVMEIGKYFVITVR
jgi:hypothetical protein